MYEKLPEQVQEFVVGRQNILAMARSLKTNVVMIDLGCPPVVQDIYHVSIMNWENGEVLYCQAFPKLARAKSYADFLTNFHHMTCYHQYNFPVGHIRKVIAQEIADDNVI